MGNETTVSAGAIAGALATVCWWAAGQFAAIQAPEFVVASTVVLLTAAVQYFVKGKPS